MLCVGGNEGYGGAIRLSAEAALRTGAGLVKVFCHEASKHVVNNSRPEIMVETHSECVAQNLLWCSAVVIGPGLGKDHWAEELLRKVLPHCLHFQKPLIIDADAVNLIGRLLGVCYSKKTCDYNTARQRQDDCCIAQLKM